MFVVFVLLGLAIILFIISRKIPDPTWKRMVDVSTVLATLIALVAFINSLTASAPISPTPTISALPTDRPFEQTITPQPETTQIPTQTQPAPTQTRPAIVGIHVDSWDEGEQANSALADLLTELDSQDSSIEVSGPDYLDFDSYVNKLRMEGGMGLTPEVFALPAFGLKPLLDEKFLTPIDDYFYSDINPEIFHPHSLDLFKDENGTLFGLPRTIEVFSLLYDIEAFNRTSYGTVPEYWDEFKDALKHLSNPEENYYGLCLPDGIVGWLLFYYRSGAESILELESGQVQNAAQEFQSLFMENLARTPAHWGYQTCGEALAGNRSASALGTKTILDEARMAIDDPARFGAVTVPREPTDQSTIAFIDGYGISANAGYPEDAWKVIRYLMSEEAIKRWADARGAVAPIKSVAQQQAEDDPSMLPFVEGAEHARGIELSLLPPETIQVLQSAVINLQQGKISVDEFSNELLERFER